MSKRRLGAKELTKLNKSRNVQETIHITNNLRTVHKTTEVFITNKVEMNNTLTVFNTR